MSAVKKERVEFRATHEAKLSIEEAAAISGKTVSSFVHDLVTKKAQEIINERKRLLVSESQWESLMWALEKPTKPTALMDEIINLSMEDTPWTVTLNNVM
jgi:uncharacterized protein (DUF1778 family)